MRYLLLIHVDPSAGDDARPEEREATMKEWFAYTEDLRAAGCLIDGNALHGPDTATTVRVSGDEVTVTDGPFAETKEHLGGYYMVDCDDLDGALHWAGRCPGARIGAIEVRPVMDIPDQPASD